jgi:hypothetical protein
MACAGPDAGPILDVVPAHAREHDDAIARIFDGTIGGIIVRGVLDRTHVAELVRRLTSDGGSLPTFRPPVFKGYVLGRPLVSASDGLAAYLDDAERFRTGCAAIFDEFPRMEERIHDAIVALADGQQVQVPRGSDGRPYLATTVRVLIEGDRLPLHYENETFGNPAMEALRPALDARTLMSFYLPLATPSSGGVLRLFHTHALNGGDSLIERLGGEERARPQFEQWGFSAVLPAIGDLLIFDGGRWYHEVTPVGAGARWTLGGFLAMTRDRQTVHYWS